MPPAAAPSPALKEPRLALGDGRCGAVIEVTVAGGTEGEGDADPAGRELAGGGRPLAAASRANRWSTFSRWKRFFKWTSKLPTVISGPGV